MSNDKNNESSSDDLKTDSVPDAPREINVTDDVEENSSMPLPSKAESINEPNVLPSKEESVNEPDVPKSNDKTYLQPPKDPSHPTKKKTSPKSMPKSPKNKKEKKKPPEASNVVYQISHSSGIRIGADYNVTIVQNSSGSKSQTAPKETETVRELRKSNQQVTRDHICVIAPHIGDNWRYVGRTLNLTEGRLEQIKQDNFAEGMKEVVFKMILEWMRTNASGATVGELTNALWNCNEYSAVKKLAEWYKEFARL